MPIKALHITKTRSWFHCNSYFLQHLNHSPNHTPFPALASKYYRSRSTGYITQAQVELSISPIDQEHAVPYEMRVEAKDKYNHFLENYNYRDFLIDNQVPD